MLAAAGQSTGAGTHDNFLTYNIGKLRIICSDFFQIYIEGCVAATFSGIL